MTRWTRRIMFLNAVLVGAVACYLYSDTITGWFPLLSVYPAPCALALVFTISQWEVAIRGPHKRRTKVLQRQREAMATVQTLLPPPLPGVPGFLCDPGYLHPVRSNTAA